MKRYIYTSIFVALLGFIAACKKDSTSPSGMNTAGGTTGSTTGTTGSSGTGGSMARFTISGEYLYTVSTNSLQVFNIADGANPLQRKTISLDGGVETIFPFKNYLLLGSQNGMIIMDNTNPSSPHKTSIYSHITSCDPVVAEGNYAYVTLHTESGTTGSGTISRCNNGTNALEVIDITNINNPVMRKSFTMTRPLGLGVDGNLLFVCDNGLKVYDRTDPVNLTFTKTFPGMDAYDLIPENKVLMMVSAEGLYQYSYADPNNIVQISKIPVKK